MSNIQLASPDNEPLPAGKENTYRPVNYTTAAGQQQLKRERIRQHQRQQQEAQRAHHDRLRRGP